MPKHRLHSLDALRTLAALAVVVRHWPEHFFWVKRFSAPLDRSPFFHALSLAYLNGEQAVTFFFCLSGFVFFWLYAETVRDRTMSAREFTLLRVSRLYPLHLATLVALVPLVLVMWARFHSHFVYDTDDVYHFVLNLFCVQYWGFQAGYSWNAPSWSISVEAALYILFFLACRLWRPGFAQALCLAAVAVALSRFSIIANSAVAFFCGGCAYYAYDRLLRRGRTWHAAAAVGATALAWIALSPLSDPQVASAAVARFAAELPAGAARTVGRLLAKTVCERTLDGLLFPALILSAALVESHTQRLAWRWLAGVGNLSYSVYLLHFPLQLLAVLIALWAAAPADTFTRPWVFVAFMAALLALSVASYAFLERPAMRAMRKWALRAASVEAPAGLQPALASQSALEPSNRP